MAKKINLLLATLYSIILAALESILNTIWDDWGYIPLWIVDYIIVIILLSAVFIFKNNFQNIILLLGWSFSAGITYMALFVSMDPNFIKSPDIEGKLPLFGLAFIISVIGILLSLADNMEFLKNKSN
tara:strand:+ start:2424 stop:2804 length:381 start_codon:yes stop_codon:yes gene_type:complete